MHEAPWECKRIWPDLNRSTNEQLPDLDLAPGREGNQRIVQHLLRERSRQVVAKKKSAVLRLTGRLDCEVCSFNFTDAFGQRGEDFCEVHHLMPLSVSNGEVRTRLEQLAIVCSNCHRMLHRNPWIRIEELRSIRTSHKRLSARRANKIKCP